MAVAFVQLTINDYTKWRAVFDQHKDLRDKAGLTNIQVYRNADNLKDVIVSGEAADTEKATNGLLNPEMRAAMQEAGVVGPPRIHWTS